MILAKGGGSYLHIQGYFPLGGLANPGGQVIVVAFNFLWRGGGEEPNSYRRSSFPKPPARPYIPSQRCRVARNGYHLALIFFKECHRIERPLEIAADISEYTAAGGGKVYRQKNISIWSPYLELFPF